MIARLCPSVTRIEMPENPLWIPGCEEIDPDQLRENISLAGREAAQRGRHTDGNQTVRGTGVHNSMHRTEDGAAIQAVMNRNLAMYATINRIFSIPGQLRVLPNLPNQLTNIAAFPWQRRGRPHPNAVGPLTNESGADSSPQNHQQDITVVY